MKIAPLGLLMICTVGWGCSTPGASHADGATSSEVGGDAHGPAEVANVEAGADAASCHGQTLTCVKGGPAGEVFLCDDQAVAPVCVDAQLHCPDGSVRPNLCTCSGPAAPGCTCSKHGWVCADAGVVASVDAGGSCSLPAASSFSFSGADADRSDIGSPNLYQYYHSFLPAKDPRQVNCRYEIPCSSPTAVTVPAIAAAIENADVQAALAKPKGMLYGTDPRPAGAAWTFDRIDGRGFLLGTGDVPAGLRALQTLLDKAMADMLASPACAALPR